MHKCTRMHTRTHTRTRARTQACSSALVALHSAVSALRLAQCGAAVAGGANLCLTPDTPAAFQSAGA